jgi:hypothetical protein
MFRRKFLHALLSIPFMPPALPGPAASVDANFMVIWKLTQECKRLGWRVIR